MHVRDLMTSQPVTIHAGTSLRTAIRLLAERQVTILPVVDDEERILGVVSEVDLLRSTESRVAGASDVPNVVADVMTRPAVVVHPEADLLEVGGIVGSTSIKSIPVVNADNQVVGIVSRSDVVRVLARNDDELQQDIVDALSAAGLRGWRVSVHNGTVDLAAPREGSAEEARARGIAETTPGVAAVRVH